MTGRVRSAAHSAVLIKSGSRTLKPSAQPPERVSVVGLLTVGFSRKRPPAPYSVSPLAAREAMRDRAAGARTGEAVVRRITPRGGHEAVGRLSLARGPDDLCAYHRGPQDVSDLHFERHTNGRLRGKPTRRPPESPPGRKAASTRKHRKKASLKT